MNKLIALLRSPYPVLCQQWKTVLIPSVIIFLILFFLQPFGISLMHHHKIWMLLGYAVTSALASSVPIYLLPFLFPSYYEEYNWTLGKHLLNMLLLCLFVAVGIWLYSSWLFKAELQVSFFIICLCWVFLLAPFPIVIFIMWNRNLLLARNLKEATEINLYLAKKVQAVGRNENDEKGVPDCLLVFTGGTKEMLEVNATDFLYAQAEGNYIEINYCSAGKRRKKLLRATMKQAEEAVEACTFISRCHRAFLVNTRAVVKVDGNSQGYRLQLEGCEDEVPVSRAYAKEVKMLIENTAEA